MIIHEIVGCMQKPGQSFDEFYTEIHNLTFRLRRKMPESELVSIMKSNLRGNVSLVMFSSKAESIGELRKEYIRAEKFLKDRQKGKNVSEITVDEKNEAVGLEAFETFGKNVSSHVSQNNAPKFRQNETRNGCNQPSPITSGDSALRQNMKVWCLSPFHLNLCYSCGMPVDFYRKLSNTMQQDNVCKSTFHDMKCFACGKSDSLLEYEPKVGNGKVAELSGNLCQSADNPETSQCNY